MPVALRLVGGLSRHRDVNSLELAFGIDKEMSGREQRDRQLESQPESAARPVSCAVSPNNKRTCFRNGDRVSKHQCIEFEKSCYKNQYNEFYINI